jgi:anti-sigma B factor antagonist
MANARDSQVNVVQSIRREAAAVVLDLKGDVDLHRSVGLRASLLEVLNEKPALMVVNLGEVDFMDSSGLATLVEALQVSRRHGIDLRLTGMRPRVRSIFEISRLDGIFRIFGSEQEALAK